MAREENPYSNRILWPICLSVYPQAKCLAHTIAQIFQGKVGCRRHKDTALHI